MRIFVTGGSGFAGGHIIEGLAGQHEVRAMARSDRSAEVVRGYGASPVRCSLADVDVGHLEGVDVVVHAAAFVEEYGTREQFEAINVHGTQRLVEAARAAGVKRFIHVGTEAVYFTGEPLVDLTEDRPFPERHAFLYSETKAEAERIVLGADRADFTAISVRPSFIWGPRDTTVLPAIRRMVDAGSYTWIDGGAHLHSTTHVFNLVAAIEAALTRGRGGQAYFVADDQVRTLRQFMEDLAASEGLELPSRSLPGWLMRPVARLLHRTWLLLGRTTPPPITAFTAAIMSRQVTVNTTKARRELGWSPVIDVQEGCRQLRAA